MFIFRRFTLIVLVSLLTCFSTIAVADSSGKSCPNAGTQVVEGSKVTTDTAKKKKKKKKKKKSKKKKKKQNRTPAGTRTLNIAGATIVEVDTCAAVEGRESTVGDYKGFNPFAILVARNKSSLRASSDYPAMKGDGNEDGFSISGTSKANVGGQSVTATTTITAVLSDGSDPQFLKYLVSITVAYGDVCEITRMGDFSGGFGI